MPNEFTKKTSIPLAHDKDTMRRVDFAQERDPRLLKLIAEDDRLELAIRRRDGIEIHRHAKGRMASGVSKTRSASAVRLSRERPVGWFSLTSKIALTPRQSQSGRANRQKNARTAATKASP